MHHLARNIHRMIARFGSFKSISSYAGKIIRCKAAILPEPENHLVIDEIEVYPPQQGEVRVKIAATGVCYSDLNAQDRPLANTLYPVILGHEGAGIVESVGEGVTSVKPGDAVLPMFVPQCRNCRLCFDRRTNVCLEMFSKVINRTVMSDGRPRFRWRGKPAYHYLGTSTFTEYTVIRESAAVKINNAAPLDKVCIYGCAVPTGYGAAQKSAKVKSGSTCAIWGLGCVGLTAAAGCRDAGAKLIIGIDVNPQKFEFGQEFGCTNLIDGNKGNSDVNKTILELTGGLGVDYSLVCVGSVDAMNQAFESTTLAGGTMCLVGLSPAGAELIIDPFYITCGRKVIGSFCGDYKTRDEIPGLVDHYMKGNLPTDRLITGEYTLENINEALQDIRRGNGMRRVIHVDKTARRRMSPAVKSTQSH